VSPRKPKVSGVPPQIPGRQPAGAEIAISPAKWKILHLASLDEVYRAKGKNPPIWDPQFLQTPHGKLGDTSFVETPCVRCRAQRVEVIPAGIVCVGCGTSAAPAEDSEVESLAVEVDREISDESEPIPTAP